MQVRQIVTTGCCEMITKKVGAACDDRTRSMYFARMYYLDPIDSRVYTSRNLLSRFQPKRILASYSLSVFEYNEH